MSNLIRYKILVTPTYPKHHESNVILPHEYLEKLFEKKQLPATTEQ
jgi:hypothetical protein